MTTSTSTKTLNVGTIAQKIAFLFMAKGQISDGMWENARPYEHWKSWSSLNWNNVNVDPSNVGRDFSVLKDNYNLNSNELVEIVKDRLIFMIKLYMLYPDIAEELFIEEITFENPNSFDFYTKETTSSYLKACAAKINELGVSKEMLQKVAESSVYGLPELRRDLAGLRKAMKTWN